MNNVIEKAAALAQVVRVSRLLVNDYDFLNSIASLHVPVDQSDARYDEIINLLTTKIEEFKKLP